MVHKLVAISEKYKLLCWPVRIFCWLVFTAVSAWNECMGWLRCMGIGGKSYERMKQYKDIHKGQRCFIICTGPSLTVEDLERLKDEITFGMNSITKVYGKTDFRPTYYGIQDCGVYASMEKELLEIYGDQDNVFLSDRITWHSKVGKNWNVFPLNMSYNAYGRWFRQIFNVKFSDDVYRRVYDGFSITYSLIEIAVYMGFREICLIGADCSFADPKKLHFIEHGVKDHTIDTARERNLAGYEEAKRASESRDFTIYNATRGGALEIFERKTLEQILAE